MDTANLLEDTLINSRVISIQTKLDTELTKVLSIFRYEGLPLTAPRRELERRLTRDGQAVLYMHEDQLFVTSDLPSESPDIYGQNRVVHIDHGGQTLTRTVGVDAVLARNDDGAIGLEHIVTEYAILAAQSKVTMLRNLVDLRGKYVLQAKDQNSYEAALEYEKSVRRGDTAVILAEEFAEMDGINFYSAPMPTGIATQTIELHQYVTALYYSELGITLNNNMKSQYVSDSELQKSTGMPLIMNMLEARRELVRDVAALFDIDISVSLSSEWDDELDQEVTHEEPASDEAAGSDAAEPAAGAAGGDEPAEAEAGEPAPEAEPLEPVSREELTEATEALLEEAA